jgi:signal transduction histidine kinase/HAMP domain-containing protein
VRRTAGGSNGHGAAFIKILITFSYIIALRRGHGPLIMESIAKWRVDGILKLMPLRVKTSIGTLIFIAFAAMGMITGALGGYGLFILSAAGDVVADTYDRSLMAVSFARSASLEFSRMESELLRRSIAAPGEQAASNAKLDRLAASFGEDLGVAAERSLAPDERDVIREIRTLAARWAELRDAGANAAQERDDLGEKIIERLDMLIELTADHSFVARRKAVMKMRLFTYSSFGAIALALLLSAAITLLLTRRIMRPLSAAAAVADRIAQGELETPIPKGGQDETGVLLRSMTVMQDNIRVMVEREQAQRRSAQTRLVDALESSREAIVLVDAESRIVIANSQLASFFPTVAPQLEIGLSFTDAFRELDEVVSRGGSPDATHPAGDRAKRDLLSAGSEFRLADGRWLRVSRSATQDGGFFLLISDFSDIKEREERLDEARRQAEAASEAKSAFLATISHELRTPLNAVIGFSEILSSQMFGQLGDPKYVDYAQSIQHSGTHLLGIINNVLDLTKYQAGKLELVQESIDLVAIVENGVAIMRDQCARAELALITRLPDTLVMRGDPGKLQQMLLNLLSNAVKFTKPGGSVTVLAEAVAGGSIRLQVADSGIGMSPDEIPIALAVFGQVDSRLARRYDGTGLGLPLAKSIAELHGGTVAIDSAPGKGTTVTISLPRERAGSAVADGGTALDRVA